MSKPYPVVSVVVPVFNRLKLLKATVESLMSQTLMESEFLLVDDNSQSEVWEYLQRLPQIDQRFKVLRKPEHLARGCQTSRNLGLSLVRSTFVMFLDSDDLLSPDCLESRAAFMLDQPDVDIAVGNQAVFHDASGEGYWVNIPDNTQDDIDRFLALAMPIDVPWVNAGCLIRMSSLKVAGVQWRESFHWDDVVFHVDCLLAKLKPGWMPRSVVPDAWYRLHGEEHYGATLMSAEGLENTSRMFTFLIEQLQARQLLSSVKLSLLRRSFFHCCLLRAVDQELWALVAAMLEKARASEIYSSREVRHLRRFAHARRMVVRFPRLRFQINRWVRRRSLQQYFCSPESTYCSIPVTPSSLLTIAPFDIQTTKSSYVRE
ncbi:MAG: glycosyltransferase family A protein [Planctomycetaceae bacterium]